MRKYVMYYVMLPNGTSMWCNFLKLSHSSYWCIFRIYIYVALHVKTNNHVLRNFVLERHIQYRVH